MTRSRPGDVPAEDPLDPRTTTGSARFAWLALRLPAAQLRYDVRQLPQRRNES